MTPARRFDDARVLAVRGRLAEAHQAVDEVLADEPRHLGALLLKAGLLLEARESDEALSVYRRAAREWERSSAALNGVARCLHLLGQSDEALEAAERARLLLPEADNGLETGPVYLTVVWCLRDRGRLREALTLAEEGLAKCSDAVLAHWAGVVEEELAEAEKERC